MEQQRLLSLLKKKKKIKKGILLSMIKCELWCRKWSYL